MMSILFLFAAAWATDDVRLAKPDVAECVEEAKRFMSSNAYSGRENEQELIGACRDVEPSCVSVVGESYHPRGASGTKDFLQLVRACRGRGMGDCAREQMGRVASYDRREISELKALLKKCE